MSVNNRGELSNGLPPDELSGGGDYEPRPTGLDRKTELELLDAALQDNINAFSELFEHYRPALYGLCCRRLNDFALAEDVVQEVFLKAFKSLPNSDHRKPIWPWLAAIAHRMCIDVQRRRSLIHYSGDIRLTMDEDAETNGHTESALDELIASEDRAELWKSLEVLPARQRRAFVLYEVDGLSCADIAAAEGISVGAVKLLLFRARKKMRSASQGRPLPAIVFPFTWLRWKLQRMEERIRPLLGVYSDGFSSACVQAACLSTVAMMVIATTSPTDSSKRDDRAQSDVTVLLATQSRTLETVLPNNVAPVKSSVYFQQSVAEAATSLADHVINPGESATPENTIFDTIVPSPNYENDHTILASGYCGKCVGRLVFASNDGGANWKPLPSRLFFGRTIAFSPGYPQDQRIFALGDLGFQQSDDGGETFRTVTPLLGESLAISPSFDREESRVLIGSGTIFEYDAGTGVTRPAFPTIPQSQGNGPKITFSPTYLSDHTVFVSDNYAKGEDLLHPTYDQSTVYRCKKSTCDEMQFPIVGPLKLRLSPRFDQDSLVYAFTSIGLLVSRDEAQTFQEVPIPLDGRNIEDMAILWGTSSDPALFVSTNAFTLNTPGVYRSLDAGHSWHRTGIDIPGFDYGSKKLIVTPTGRLLATGNYGIACSIDKAQTWARRCPPEQ